MSAPIVLSSSPPSLQPTIVPTPPSVKQRPTLAGLAPRSSPLPSPTALLPHTGLVTVNNCRLKSGSRAQELPDGASAGFESAGKLLREKLLDLGDEKSHEQDIVLETRVKATTKAKARTQIKAKAKPKTTPKTTLKTKAKTPEKKVTAARRKNKDEADCGRPAPEKACTRVRTTDRFVGPQEMLQDRQDNSVYDANLKTTLKQTKPMSADSNKIVELAPTAVVRRSKWTPVKDTRDTCDPSVTRMTPAREGQPFTLNLTRFTYSAVVATAVLGDALSNPSTYSKGSTKTTKKRRLDLVDAPVQTASDAQSSRKRGKSGTRHASPTTPPAAHKAPKRPKTITELTIAPFRKVAVKDAAEASVVTSGFFESKPISTDTAVVTVDAVDLGTSFKPPTKPRLRKSRQKVPKQNPLKQKLLDPDAFSRRMGRQDLLFGTASQLTNESSTYLKQYRQAILESEAEASVEITDSIMISNDKHPKADAAEQTLSKPVEATRLLNLGGDLTCDRPFDGLWNAARRDIDNDIWEPTQVPKLHAVSTAGTGHEKERQEPSDSTLHMQAPAPTSSQKAICDSHTADETVSDCNVRNESFVDIDEIVGQSFERSSGGPAVSEIPVSNENNDKAVNSVSSPSSCRNFGNTAISPVASINLKNRSSCRSALEPLNPNRTQKAIRTYSGKAHIRSISTNTTSAFGTLSVQSSPTAESLADMNATLEKLTCSTAATNIPPKRPRGRPRKNTATKTEATSAPKRKPRLKDESKQGPVKAGRRTRNDLPSTLPQSRKHVDEIEDSEPDISPSPPRRTTKRPVSALELISSQDDVVEDMPAKKTDFETQRESIFARITHVVKTNPRTTDPNKPSWHEKILLYDPIVLEDFTGWLNQQGLKYKKHSGPRNNSRTSKEKRKGSDKVDTGKHENTAEREIVVDGMMEVPLDVWMVQKWCEAHSICCLWREGLRGGVKASY